MGKTSAITTLFIISVLVLVVTLDHHFVDSFQVKNLYVNQYENIDNTYCRGINRTDFTFVISDTTQISYVRTEGRQVMFGSLSSWSTYNFDYDSQVLTINVAYNNTPANISFVFMDENLVQSTFNYTYDCIVWKGPLQVQIDPIKLYFNPTLNRFEGMVTFPGVQSMRVTCFLQDILCSMVPYDQFESPPTTYLIRLTPSSVVDVKGWGVKIVNFYDSEYANISVESTVVFLDTTLPTPTISIEQVSTSIGLGSVSTNMSTKGTTVAGYVQASSIDNGLLIFSGGRGGGMASVYPVMGTPETALIQFSTIMTGYNPTTFVGLSKTIPGGLKRYLINPSYPNNLLVLTPYPIPDNNAYLNPLYIGSDSNITNPGYDHYYSFESQIIYSQLRSITIESLGNRDQESLQQIPYGLVGVYINQTTNQRQYKYKLSIPFEDTMNIIYTTIRGNRDVYIDSRSQARNLTKTYQKATITSCNITHAGLSSYIYSFSLGQKYGFHSISLNNIGIRNYEIYQGDVFGLGYYETEVNITKSLAFRYGLDVISLQNGTVYVIEGSYIGADYFTIPSFPVFIAKLEDITYFNWSHKIVDVSESSQTIMLYFNVSTLTEEDKLKSPTLYVYDFYHDSKPDTESTSYGTWNDTLKLFQIPVYIREKSFSGVLNYELGFGPTPISQSILRTVFDDQSVVMVKSMIADLQGPIVKSITALNGTSAYVGSGLDKISWLIDIDSIVGLYNNSDYSYALVTSDLYPKQIKTNLTYVSGDAFSSTYRIDFEVSANYVNQTYELDLVLMDYLDNVASSLLDVKFRADTLRYFRNTTKMDSTKITLKTPITQDSVNLFNPFTLLSLTIPSTVINTAAFERTISIVFQTNDPVGGLSSLYNPIVTLDAGSSYRVSGEAIPILPITSPITFNATITIPFGFGIVINRALVSIYGLVSNHMAIGGFSTDTIFSLGYDSKVNLNHNFSGLPPILESVSPITSEGGLLTVRGHLLRSTDKCAVVYDQDIVTNVVNPTFVSNTYMLLPIAPFINQFKLYCQDVNFVTSNLYVVIAHNPANDQKYPPRPYPLPVVPSLPLTCPNVTFTNGTVLLCNNMGNCDKHTGLCNCFGNWTGPSCTNQPTIDTPIIVDPTKPTTSTPNKIDISIVEVQEIGVTNNIVERYPLVGRWKSTPQTNNGNISSTNLYTATFSDVNTKAGSILVKVESFHQAATVVYANTTLSMLQGSVKYSISLSSYIFQSKLNTLRLVLSTDVITNGADGSCVVSESNTDIDNIQWIKLQVDDKSLYGRFLKSGYIDGRQTTIKNKLLLQTPEQTLIGMDIPYYIYTASLDPDFSTLIDNKNAKDNDNSVCFNSEKEKFWTTPRLVGLIIGCVGGLIVISVIAVFTIKRQVSLKLKMMHEERKNKKYIKKTSAKMAEF